jgi:hypothetical protein
MARKLAQHIYDTQRKKNVNQIKDFIACKTDLLTERPYTSSYEPARR